MRRLFVALACTACVSLPFARAQSGFAATAPTAAKLRVAPSAFAPATLTTDEVENNDSASANYIGTHHPGPYSSMGRITGYYQRAVHNNAVYLRLQSSIFPDAKTATDVMTSSVNWASTHFGGANACSGEDDTIDAKGNPVDTDNPNIATLTIDTTQARDYDQDPSCYLPLATGNGAVMRSLQDAAGTDDCTSADEDDMGGTAGSTDADLCDQAFAVDKLCVTATRCVVYGPNTNAVGSDLSPPGTPDVGGYTMTSLTIGDCSGLIGGTPCSMLGFGYNDPGVDRYWYDIYVVFRVNQCLGEITLTSHPEDYGAMGVDTLLGAAAQTFGKACAG